MRKFFQGCLVTCIALGLILVLAHQVLTRSTIRGRDVSVTALKEKLAQLEAGRAPVPAAVTAPDPEANVSTAPGANDIAELRARWRALLGTLADPGATWSAGSKLSQKVLDTFSGREEVTLAEADLEQLQAYGEQMQDLLAELQALIAINTDSWEVFGPDFRADSEEASYGFPMAAWELEYLAQRRATTGDYAGAIDAIRAYIDLTKLSTPWYMLDIPTKWQIIRNALEQGTVDDAHWQPLLDSMAARRDPRLAGKKVAVGSRELLAIYANWPQSAHFTFAEHPLLYSQNWAYRNVTTPLFNHDLETFGRAMDILLDLAPHPYYEIKPALEQFAEDFGVESSPDRIAIYHGNPAWRYIFGLTRVHLPMEASYEGALDTARIAILLDRYRSQTGTYPEALDVLAEDLGGEVPRCPVDGAPYTYTRQGDTYQLEYRAILSPDIVAQHDIPPIQVTPWFQEPKKGKPESGEQDAEETEP